MSVMPEATAPASQKKASQLHKKNCSTHLDRNVIIVLELNTGVLTLSAEQFGFERLVALHRRTATVVMAATAAATAHVVAGEAATAAATTASITARIPAAESATAESSLTAAIAVAPTLAALAATTAAALMADVTSTEVASPSPALAESSIARSTSIPSPVARSVAPTPIARGRRCIMTRRRCSPLRLLCRRGRRLPTQMGRNVRARRGLVGRTYGWFKQSRTHIRAENDRDSG
jgi:hypothetical protein